MLLIFFDVTGGLLIVILLIIIVISGIVVLFDQFPSVILPKGKVSDQNTENYFSSNIAQFKTSIDLIDAPVLMVIKQEPKIPLSVLKQIKQELPNSANMIAYYVNQYAHQYYQDIILDILRHPMFFNVLEQQNFGKPISIELAFDLPKPYHFTLSFQSLKKDYPFHLLTLVTLTDQTKAISLNKMRSDFIAHASHELRTPLTSLDGFIQTFQSGDVDDPEIQQQFLAIMRSQVNRMIRLTNGLLDLSRVERDEYQSLSESIDLKEVIKQIQIETEVKPNINHIQFSFDLPSDEQECFIEADRDQIFQIIQNLLANAVYYTPFGLNKPFTVQCRLFFVTEDDEWPGTGWVISIIDNGPGIEKHHIPRLTERFYRADDKNGQTGLGLAIVKHMVIRHHGILKITSQVGLGSQFSVWFPVIN